MTYTWHGTRPARTSARCSVTECVHGVSMTVECESCRVALREMACQPTT